VNFVSIFHFYGHFPDERGLAGALVFSSCSLPVIQLTVTEH